MEEISERKKEKYCSRYNGLRYLCVRSCRKYLWVWSSTPNGKAGKILLDKVFKKYHLGVLLHT